MIAVSKNIIIKYSVVLMVLFSAISPMATSRVYARENLESNEARAEQITENGFCTEINKITTRLDEQVVKKINKINDLQAQKSIKLSHQFSERDEKLIQSRAKWDENRQQHYQKLYENAKNDDQKKAIDQFRATVETAVAKRRAAVDESIETFRNTIISSVSSRQGSVDSLIDNYKSELNTAKNSAQSNCSNGISSPEVRQNYRNQLQSARNNLLSGKQGIEKVDDNINAAVQNRRTSIDQAISTFRATLQQTRDALKTSLNQ